MDCLTPSNPVPYKHGYTQTIEETVQKNFGDDKFKDLYGKELDSVLELSKKFKCEKEWEERSKTLGIVALDEIKDQLANNARDIQRKMKQRGTSEVKKIETIPTTDLNFADTKISATRIDYSKVSKVDNLQSSPRYSKPPVRKKPFEKGTFKAQ